MPTGAVLRRFQQWQRQGAARGSDAELLAQFVSKRDEASFRTIVERHGDGVLAAARRVLGSRAEVEDVFQATFLTLVQRPTAIKRGQALGSWLYGVAQRLALRAQRDQQREQKRAERATATAKLDAATRQVMVDEFNLELGKALERLPERYRQALIYCYLEERSPEAAAKLLGIPVGTLWSRLSRGREKLRRILEKRGWPLGAAALAALLASGDVNAGGELVASLFRSLEFGPKLAVKLPLKAAIAGMLVKEKAMVTTGAVTRALLVSVLVVAGGLGMATLVGWARTDSGSSQDAATAPVVLVEPVVISEHAEKMPEKKGRIVGTVTETGTGMPIKGAKLEVEVEGLPEGKGTLSAESDDSGQFLMPVPFGELRLGLIQNPPRYCCRRLEVDPVFVVNAQQPERRINIQLERGPAWSVAVRGVKLDPKTPSLVQLRPQGSRRTGFLIPFQGWQLSAGGEGSIVVPNEFGASFSISYRTAPVQGDLILSGAALYSIGNGFDPNAVASLPPSERRIYVVTDANGRTARIMTDKAELVDKRLRLVASPITSLPDDSIGIGATVKDEKGQAIADATVNVSFGRSLYLIEPFRTDTNGRFEEKKVRLFSLRYQGEPRVGLFVHKPGYAGVLTETWPIRDFSSHFVKDVGTITLKRAKPLRGLVVDSTGKPVEGAVVQCSSVPTLDPAAANDPVLFGKWLTARSHQDGRFELTNPGVGRFRVSASYGQQSGHTDFELPDEGKELVIRLPKSPDERRPRVSPRDSGSAKPVAQPTSMEVTVLDAEGKPLVGADLTVGVWTDEVGFKRTREYKTDAAGLARVALPKTFTIVRLWAGFWDSKKPFVTMFAGWEEPEIKGGEKLPDKYTFKLERGTTAGGKVVDEQGKAIAGATVEVRMSGGTEPVQGDGRAKYNTWLARGKDALTTDQDGRWQIQNVPDHAETELSILVSHPAYIADGDWRENRPGGSPSTAKLREGSATTTLKRGIILSGRVTDPMGRPIKDAVVSHGSDPYGAVRMSEFLTDADGRFRLPALPPSSTMLTVIAQGWAPQLRVVNATDPPTQDFKMEPGKPIKLIVVDGSGQPVPSALVAVTGWRGAKSLHNQDPPNVRDNKIPRRTNADGVWEWTWAPGDNVKLTIYAANGGRRTDLEMAGGEPTRTVVLGH